MRKTLGLLSGVLVLLAISTGANATDYTYTGDNGVYFHDDVTAWSPQGVPGLDNIDGAADTITLPGTVAADLGVVVFDNPEGPAVEYYIGALTIDNGEIRNASNYDAPFNLHVRDDGGHSGDLIIRNSGYMQWANGSAWEIDGDLRVQNNGMRNYSLQGLVLTMNGAGKVIDVDDSDWMDHLIIPEGASISPGDGTYGSYIRTSNFELYGTVTGVVEVLGDVIIGENATWDTGVLRLRRYSGVSETRIYASQIPGFDGNSNGYINGNPPTRRTVRLKDDLTVVNDLMFNVGYGSYGRDWNDVFTTDNGNAYSWNLTVNGNLAIGGGTRVSDTIRHGLEVGSSQVTVGGDMTVDRYGYIVGGTSQWTLNGNVVFTDLARNDLSSMGETMVTIAGDSAQNLDFADDLKLGDLVIDKTGGTATLMDNVLLGGDLDILAGTFDTNGMQIVFNGPDHGLQDQVGTILDQVVLLDNSVVVLGSDVTMDSLFMGLDSELHILGYQLTVGEQTFQGPGMWNYDGGTIMGIPEPATLLLASTGLLVLVGRRRRRRMR